MILVIDDLLRRDRAARDAGARPVDRETELPGGVEPLDTEQVVARLEPDVAAALDHAGGLDGFPEAVFHIQAAEMAFATGPCMCHGTLQMPFTVDHVFYHGAEACHVTASFGHLLSHGA